MALTISSRLGWAGHGTARPGAAGLGMERHTRELRAVNSSTDFFTAGRGAAWIGVARLGKARPGAAWLGTARHTRELRAVNSGTC